MKIGRLLGVGLLAAFLFAPVALFAQQQATTNFQSFVIESFDNPDESVWRVTGSKFLSQEEFRVGYVESFPRALYPNPPEDRTLRVLGVEAAFNRLGYNFLEYVPVEENQDGEVVPRGIPIPGRVRYMDMWVWGSNHDYYVDVHLRDHRGIVHVLKLGDIDYTGWRNLRIDIPTWIPQEVPYVPQFKGLELVKIVLWTRPSEKVDGFFVYFDEIKVETDMFEQPFDGEVLANPARVQQLWSNAVQPPAVQPGTQE